MCKSALLGSMLKDCCFLSSLERPPFFTPILLCGFSGVGEGRPILSPRGFGVNGWYSQALQDPVREAELNIRQFQKLATRSQGQRGRLGYGVQLRNDGLRTRGILYILYIYVYIIHTYMYIYIYIYMSRCFPISNVCMPEIALIAWKWETTIKCIDRQTLAGVLS